MKSHLKAILGTLLVLLVLSGLFATTFVYFGVFDVAADDPHSAPVLALVNATRNRSIAVRARNVVVPKLDDRKLVLEGAGHYSEMCTECHLAPGMADNDMRPGLYPKPPNLSKVRVDPRTAFWVVKHGLKMTGMPGFGATHDDQKIWAMVAFLRKLPDLSPSEYEAIVKQAPPDDDDAPAMVAPAPMTSNTIRIEVTKKGFEPSTATIAAGRPVTLVVTRVTDRTCAKSIVFPSLNVRKDLPRNEPVTLTLPAQKSGQLSFQCGMGMLKGALVVQ